MNTWSIKLVLSAVALGAGSVVMAGQQPARAGRPPLTIGSLVGRDTFEFYCAPCHGLDGRGHGPVAAALSTTPPDLTLMASRHGGVFPANDVRGFVTGTGRPVVAHGPGSMPIWGPTFQALDPSDSRVKVRISNVVKYVESIQRTPPAEKGTPAEKGAR